MPRPRIHRTKAERCAANRAKSARHYAKNKADILARRRDIRAQGENVTQPSEASPATTECNRNPSLPTQNSLAVASHDVHILETIDLAQRTSRKLTSFINNSPPAFANSIYMKYIKLYETGTNDITVIETPLEQLLRWQRRLDMCAEAISLECGVGKELCSVSAPRKTAGIAIEHLQELLCDAMSDPKAMQAAYKRKRYDFQFL
ncbi:hypothetical protein BDN71DRAFT_1594382 [Pleurotus eryngii]|uniref:Uncharacterized protein n=1 Tax=Pleurotus eryngii TaxID=5323 RepID=A0A9P5ZG66_PLEER|nr:hypothetical protein BDN71DRAFT_1594382 [Pleurotus eryngii]